jgi:transcriptional regulator GlxA family with amidase domain
MIDGLDGLSASIGAVEAFVLSVVHAGQGDGAPSGVALALDIPLRTLEYRFRRELGRTVSAEIQERRLGAVERMLADRNVRIESIAQMCGYRSNVNLKKQFKKRFGLSMREWRKGTE